MKTTASRMNTFVLLAFISTTLFSEEQVLRGTIDRSPNGYAAAPDPRPQPDDRAPASPFPELRDDCDANALPTIRMDHGHPWRPPFGLDKVGALPVMRVTLVGEQVQRCEYYLIAYQNGRESERQLLTLERNRTHPRASGQSTTDASRFYGNAQLTLIPDEVSVHVWSAREGQLHELARQRVDWPVVDADAAAHPDRQVNPIDLGTILVPHDWLLLAGGQKATVTAAAISHARDIPKARLRAWFEGNEAVDVAIPLAMGRRVAKELQLPLSATGDRTVLYVSLTDGSRELWRKAISTMIVVQPPRWPAFGAVETKLRYDANIPVHDPETGVALRSLNYATGWDSKLNDVVIFLPNGERLVFWRGASYVPLWASAYNTGASYQWAENLSVRVHHPDGSVDLPEPLFDSELRYGRVHIIESTASRVHVRWTYQLTDNQYNVWGDQATEDYYFYPDGFGTRVLTVMSKPGTPYQLTEFIVVTPQGAFPLDVLPKHMINVLFLDGDTKSITFPIQHDKDGAAAELVSNPRQLPMVFRLFSHKDDPAAAIYFCPSDLTAPAGYKPFYDQGQMVTPTYWGSHWPLRRGKWTHWAIDEGISASPAHNSVAGWLKMPKPVFAGELQMLDARGRSQQMTLQRWTALIAKTDAPDEVLLDWAHSFSAPPSLEVKGARIDFPSYSPERRAIRLIAESRSIEIKLKQGMRAVNPVFELDRARAELASVTIDGKPLSDDAYAWDGATLWIRSRVSGNGAKIGVLFR